MVTMDRIALRLHAGFLAAVVLVLWLPLGVAVGQKVFWLLVGWHVAFVTIALTSRRRWLGLWWFATCTSVMMILPDWFLVDGLRTLRFAADGFPDVGPVSGYMALMWAPAFVMLVQAATAAAGSRDQTLGDVSAIVGALVVFGLAEYSLTRIPLWLPLGVRTWNGIATYVLLAEAVLGLVVWRAWCRIDGAGPVVAVPAGATVMLTYLGLLGVSWVVVERVLS